MLGACALTRPTQAQIATATLTGTVVDRSGAAAQEVDIAIVNDDSGAVRLTRSGADGSFTVAELPPGAYRLDARKAGFADATRAATLHVGDRVALRITLDVGGVEGRVDVVADAPLVRTDAAVGTIVNRQFVENQPLNGRNFQALVELAPGVVLTPTNVTASGQFSVNGHRPNSNYFTVDGVSANFGVNGSATLYESSGGTLPAYSALGGMSNLVSVDALQEFTLQTSGYAPEFGRQGGAQVGVVTRSGGNRFTGTASIYARSDRFDSEDYFAEKAGLPKPELKQNDFGGVFGGPIVRDRTFFFASYEGLRLTQPATTSPIPVPTQAVRQQATGYAQAVLNAFPLPNGPVTAFDPGLAAFIGTYTVPSSLDSASVRLDHHLTDSFSAFGRFSDAPSRIDGRGGAFNPPNVTTVSPALSRTVTVGATNVWGATRLNDLRVNYSRSEFGSSFDMDAYGGAAVPPASTFVPSFADSTASGSITIHAQPTALNLGLNASNVQRQFNLVETFTWIHGGHTIKTGFDYRRLMPIQLGSGYRQLVSFTSVAQVLAETAGTVTLISANVGSLHPIYNNYSAFVQDDWRANARTTLTYGVRYEVNPAPYDANGNNPLTVTGVDNPSTLALAPSGTKLYDTTYNNFAPRVGLVYQLLPSRGTVLRSGVGSFYDLGYVFTGSAESTTVYPFAQIRALTNTPMSTVFNAVPPPFVVAPPYGRLFAYTPGFQLPYTIEYNAMIEQPFGASDRLSVGFVGANGERLGRVISLRNPIAQLPASFTRIDTVSNEASSRYSALQMQYQRRLSRGFQATASYTLAKSMDNVSDESIVNFQAPSTKLDPQLDWGPSAFDVRHTFSAAASYDVPAAVDGWARLFREFGFDAIVRARSALPVNVVTGTDPFGAGNVSVSRPNVVAGVPMYVDDPNVAGGQRINPAAFSTPPAGVQGTLGRNALRGFAASQLDLSVRRRFGVTKRARVELRLDAFNVTNRANFANPAGSLTDPNFGVSTQMLNSVLGSGGISGGLSPLYQIGGPRSMQFGARFVFN
jgi:hypothetical protein